MSYNTQLGWLQKMQAFSPEQQKVLLALSNDKYKWRAKDRLLAVTALDTKTLDTALAHLIQQNYVRPSFSPKRNLIFGLRERVDAK